MKRISNHIRLSPTDLANHVACRHLTTLDLEVAQQQRTPPELVAWLPASLRERGEAHERSYVESLHALGHSITDLSDCRLDDDGFRAVFEAMAIGTRVLVQAPLGDDRCVGRADVLLRVDRPSALGAWSYEPLDTKLARETRGSAILQLCAYAEMLEAIQGARPEWMHVVAPGRPFSRRSYRVDDFFAYYSLVRRRLLAFVGTGTDAPTYPDLTPHCEICRWMHECNRKRRRDDHLSLVANIRTLQIAELTAWSITTLGALGAFPMPFPGKPLRASIDSLMKVREQARVQLEAREQSRLVHETLPLVPQQGLFRLPTPSSGDVFFDLEGDPFAGELGHDYLFGYAYQDAEGHWQYVAQWAFDAAQERLAFERLVTFLMDRWATYPDLHVYHYASYEAGAMRRLMGKHAVCEDAIDRMLRARLFVDLYAIVRQAVRASVERYSIKNLEPFYQFERSVPLPEVGPHLRSVELHLERGDRSAISTETLSVVERYNRDDCLSARDLRAWLESIRATVAAAGSHLTRPLAPSPEPNEALEDREREVHTLMERLLAGIPADVAERTSEQQGPMAAGAVARIPSTRGQVQVVGVLSPDGLLRTVTTHPRPDIAGTRRRSQRAESGGHRTSREAESIPI